VPIAKHQHRPVVYAANGFGYEDGWGGALLGEPGDCEFVVWKLKKALLGKKI
jgi:hypothetical protein